MKRKSIVLSFGLFTLLAGSQCYATANITQAHHLVQNLTATDFCQLAAALNAQNPAIWTLPDEGGDVPLTLALQNATDAFGYFDEDKSRAKALRHLVQYTQPVLAKSAILDFVANEKVVLTARFATFVSRLNDFGVSITNKELLEAKINSRQRDFATSDFLQELTSEDLSAGFPILLTAVIAGAQEFIAQLGQVHWHIFASNPVDSLGFTALHHAVLQQNAAMIRFLRMQGMNPNSIDKKGDTPLLLASRTSEISSFEDMLAVFEALTENLPGQVPCALEKHDNTQYKKTALILVLENGAFDEIRQTGQSPRMNEYVPTLREAIVKCLITFGAKGGKSALNTLLLSGMTAGGRKVPMDPKKKAFFDADYQPTTFY